MHSTIYIRNVLVTVTFLALAALHLGADVVVLRNDESLSGAFSRVRDNTLVFRTSLQGQMMTPMDTVRSISADATLYIEMLDGRVYYGRLGVKEGAQHIFPLDGGAPVAIDASAIEKTLPIPTTPTTTPGASEREWDVSFGPGLQWRSDSATPVEPTARLDISGQGDVWRFEGSAVVERADPNDFPAYLRAAGELQRDLGERTRPFVGAGVERDLDRFLELRQRLGVGLYHDLYVGERSSVTGFAGVDAEYERGRRPGRRPFAGERARSRHDLNLRLGLRYYHLFANRHSLSESLTLFPAITNAGTLRARAETVYAMPVTDRLQLRFDLIVDYESDPLFGGMNRWSATVGAGVNMAF